MVLKEMSFEEFRDGRLGGNLGYRKGMNSASLNLRVTVMPPIKFWLNPTYGSGGECRLNNFKIDAMMVAILDIGTERF